ncbi:MAG TPA: ATP-binding protein [Polyangia bacterium]|jgi:signal transduction histidine kinase/CheY-like chemotaxis protein
MVTSDRSRRRAKAPSSKTPKGTSAKAPKKATAAKPVALRRREPVPKDPDQLAYAREQHRGRERAEALADLAMQLNGTRTLPDVLGASLMRVARSLGADDAGLFMFEPDDRHVAGEVEVAGGARAEVVIDVDACPHVREAVTRKRGVYFTLPEAEGGEMSWFTQFGIWGTLAVPVHIVDDNLGLVLLSYRSGALGPAPEDLAVADVLAAQYALAVDRACAGDAEREQRYLAEEEARQKGEFLAMLSHELRNPLAPIRNSIYILQRVPAGSPQANRAMQVIDRQSAHLTRLVDDLLDITRMSGGLVQLHRSRVDLAAVVQRTADDHRAQLEDAGTRFELRTPAGPVWVDGDATRLAQAIGNLLANAAKFTDKGGQVVLSLEVPSENEALVRVSDNGLGMSKSVIARLFQPFYQAEKTLARSRGGLGLGLALVRTIIDLHGGLVAATSAGPGKGSVFTLTLPQAPPAAVAVDVAATPRAGRRVLVIEDNPDAAHTLREVLEIEGHKVEIAYSGPEGLAAARHFRPEVLLCDIGLPGMDGYAVAHAFREDTRLRDVYLVALTGYAQAEDRQRATAAGFQAHLAKPSTLDAIRRVLEIARPSASA